MNKVMDMLMHGKPIAPVEGWLAYLDKDGKQIGDRDKVENNKVMIGYGNGIILSPSKENRFGVRGIVMYDDKGQVLFWWDFDDQVFDLVEGASAQVWSPIS